VAPSGLRRPRVIVTVPLSTLLGQPLAPGAVLGVGTPITGEAARRLACDADLVRLITGLPGLDCSPPGSDPGPPGRGSGASSGGRSAGVGSDATGQLTRVLAGVIGGLPGPLGGPSAVLDIGRRSQSWTPRQRDALYGQYGGRCGAPGCRRGIDVLHHIVHWAQGGTTTVANGAPFCNFHHWLVHEGGWRVVKNPAGGLVLIAPPPGWRPGTIYRHGKPLPETAPDTDAA
jgi:HNH endonuclease